MLEELVVANHPNPMPRVRQNRLSCPIFSKKSFELFPDLSNGTSNLEVHIVAETPVVENGELQFERVLHRDAVELNHYELDLFSLHFTLFQTESHIAPRAHDIDGYTFMLTTSRLTGTRRRSRGRGSAASCPYVLSAVFENGGCALSTFDSK